MLVGLIVSNTTLLVSNTTLLVQMATGRGGAPAVAPTTPATSGTPAAPPLFGRLLSVNPVYPHIDLVKVPVPVGCRKMTMCVLVCVG